MGLEGGKRRRQQGGRARLPIMYGGTKVPVWRKNKSATVIFRSFKRAEMNKVAGNWGVVNPQKYKKKKDLAIAMKLLMHYRYGDLKMRAQIDRVAKILGIRSSHYKSKTGLKRAVNKRMSGMKMRAGSYFAAELKSGLLKSIKTPLLSGGGQGNFLTMRKSSYLTGGSGRQGKFLMKGGNTGKLLQLQKKRSKLEAQLLKARSKDKEQIRKKINGINSLIKKLQKGGSKNLSEIKKLQKKRTSLEKELNKARSKDKDGIKKKLKAVNSLLNRIIKKGGSCGACGVK